MHRPEEWQKRSPHGGLSLDHALQEFFQKQKAEAKAFMEQIYMKYLEETVDTATSLGRLGTSILGAGRNSPIPTVWVAVLRRQWEKFDIPFPELSICKGA